MVVRLRNRERRVVVAPHAGHAEPTSYNAMGVEKVDDEGGHDQAVKQGRASYNVKHAVASDAQ